MASAFHAKNFVLALLLLIVALVAMPEIAHASQGTGGGLPYEDWLTSLRNSVTGPVAFTVSIMGLVIAGSVLIFGGELNAFFRTLIFLVLVMSFLVGAQNFMASFFGRGAEIDGAGDTSTRIFSLVLMVAAVAIVRHVAVAIAKFQRAKNDQPAEAAAVV